MVATQILFVFTLGFLIQFDLHIFFIHGLVKLNHQNRVRSFLWVILFLCKILDLMGQKLGKQVANEMTLPSLAKGVEESAMGVGVLGVVRVGR